MLLNLWASWCQPCLKELAELAQRQHDVRGAGLSVLALSVDELSSEHGGSPDQAQQFLDRVQFPFESGLAEPGLVDKLQLINNLILDDYRNFPLPSSFLIDKEGRLAAIYKGAVTVDEVLADADQLSLEGAARHEATQPFSGRKIANLRRHRLVMIPTRLREQGMIDEAIDYIKRHRATLASDSQFAGLLSDIARALFEQARSEEAVNCYRAAIKARPDAVAAYLGLGQVYDALGRTAEAVASLREAVKLAPQTGRGQLQLAVALQKQGDLDGALKHFREATRLLPDHAMGFLGLGKAQGTAKQYDAAATSLERAIQLDPELADAHMALGLLWIQNGRRDEGVETFRRGVELQPGDAIANHRFGVILESTGQPEEAIDYYRKAIELDPQQADAHLRLAMLLEKHGKMSDALQHYRHRLELVPNDIRVLNNVAWIFATHEDPQIRNGERALQLAMRAAQATKYREPSVLSTLAAAYAEAGRFEEAVKQGESAIELARSAGQENIVNALEEQLRSYRRGEKSPAQ